MIIITIQGLYERILMYTPLSQQKYLTCLNASVAELLARYPKDRVLSGDYTPFSSILDENTILDLYENALFDNIMFLIGMGDGYRELFEVHVLQAYNHYWGESGTYIRKRGWK